MMIFCHILQVGLLLWGRKNEPKYPTTEIISKMGESSSNKETPKRIIIPIILHLMKDTLRDAMISSRMWSLKFMSVKRN